jgi:undecaprenyl diphosphate synthase
MMEVHSLHVGIIMDGNGRWGTQQGFSRIKGHTAGARRVKELVAHAGKTGMASLTIWAYSTDNWKRNAKEVTALMALFNTYIDRESDELHQKNVKALFIGDRTALPEKLQSAMMQLEEKTKDNTGLVLQVALNYGGSDELVRAFSKLKADDMEITPESIEAALDTQGVPNPDIVIRTGMPAAEGMLSQWRSSGFMPVQSLQSVCVSTEVLWPDFTPKHLEEIIAYAKPEERLFGGQR